MLTPAQPSLFRISKDHPVLIGSRCVGCGRVAFPAVPLGCDVCGAEAPALEVVELSAEGAVHASVTVFSHFGEPPAPFGIVEVLLDAGPLTRGMLDLGTPANTGERVTASWAVVGAGPDGADLVELVFKGEGTL